MRVLRLQVCCSRVSVEFGKIKRTTKVRGPLCLDDYSGEEMKTIILIISS